MVFKIILYSFLLLYSVECHKQPHNGCLTGYMTDVQTWVDEKGVLTNSVELHTAIDLSANVNPVPVLQQKMTFMRSSQEGYIKYLSMARCRLNRVPTVFQFRDSQGRNLAQMVEYVTFYGNTFRDISSPGDQYDVSMNATRARKRIIGTGFQMQSGAIWSTGLRETNFPHLKELDLRACSIQVLGANIFEGMQNLEALYLGENEVAHIDGNAFAGLTNLIHLDFSRNEAFDDIGNIKTFADTFYVFESLKNLASLDFSFSKLSNRHMNVLKVLGPTLTRLSLCEAGLTDLEDDFFNRTSLRILDLSGNNGILSRANVLRGLENRLQVLYARDSGLKTADMFKGFNQLEILSIGMNEINSFSAEVAATLTNLQILDMDKNRIISWFDEIYSLIPKLKLLSLRNNNINVITEAMINDIADVDYVAFSGNFIVCNCHARDFYELALRNEKNHEKKELSSIYNMVDEHPTMSYHKGFHEFNMLIDRRETVFANCSEEEACYEDLHEDLNGNYLLLDFHPSAYMCLQVPESKSLQFSEVIGCNRMSREIDYDNAISNTKGKLYTMLLIPFLLVLLILGFIFRRNVRYCFITLRNSTMLSMINTHEVLDEGAIFHYDVFVSYCNEDRGWVLDHLLPHLERECSFSACLHERDFQVGHSILENIVSCMDRSRSIMLIISQRFLLSQWCQFEMHLAQHRLLETRREDLTIVLLEEVPRRLRPNTLHYLMLTKTYIVWPKNENERDLFWKRLKKSLVAIKMRPTSAEGVSMA